MKCVAVFAALFAGLVAAQSSAQSAAAPGASPSFTNSNYPVQSGQAITLTWGGSNGQPVNIILKNGSPGNLQNVITIDSNDSGNSFSWTPPADLASGTYAFEIVDASGSNFSPQFTYTGNPTGTLGLTGAPSATASGASSSTGSVTVTSSNSKSTSGSSSSSSSGSKTSSSTITTTTSSSSSSSSSATSTKPANSNDGPQLASSPLAFVLVTIAALVYVN